jgi:protein-S-isoprenylcysteine O-methyltransferase Ste14
MVPLILMILGLVVVVIGVLALLAVIHIGVVWWVLLLVGAGLILLGWYLRSRPPSVV